MKSNKPYSRVERVNKQILDILSGVLNKNVDLSFLGFVTFTNVDIAPDFKSAKIYYSILNPKLSKDQVNIEINKTVNFEFAGSIKVRGDITKIYKKWIFV